MEKPGYVPNFIDSEPRRLYLELTSRCNLNCQICYRRAWTEGTGDLPGELLEALAQEAARFSEHPEVVLGGIGEPTHAPLFDRAVKLFASCRLTVTSNGISLTEDRIAKLIAAHVNKLVISVDGGDEEYYRIRGTDLQQVRAGLANLRRHSGGPTLWLQFVASCDNIDSLRSVIDLAAQEKIHGVIISNLVPQTEEHSGKILYSRYQNEAMRNLFNRVRNHSFLRGVNLVLPNYELKTIRRCRFIDEAAMMINYLGDVVPCYRLAHNGREYVFERPKEVVRHSFGSIKKQTLREIWNSEAYRRFRYTVFTNQYPSCMDCELVDGCEIINSTVWDCEGNMPTCGDCLWARNFVICP
ncbi:MAG: radical SAM protein [Firmicutes bacterium]|nr:radical SAM protein [Bacillota bacterium]